MAPKELTAMTDEELLEEKKKLKKAKITDAVLVGFLVGIIIYSVVKNTWGMVMLIPLFFIYKLVKKSNNNKELEALLKERNLD